MIYVYGHIYIYGQGSGTSNVAISCDIWVAWLKLLQTICSASSDVRCYSHWFSHPWGLANHRRLGCIDRKLQAWAWHDIRLTYWRNMGPARLPCLCYTMIHHDTSHKNAKTVARDLHQATSRKKTMSSSLSKSWPSLEAPGFCMILCLVKKQKQPSEFP